MWFERLESRHLLAGTIEGAIWDDVDGNGVFDVAESPLADWNVYLDENQNGRFDAGESSVQTDPNGIYSFGGLTPGTYVVGEAIPPDYLQTSPASALTPLGGYGAPDPDRFNVVLYDHVTLGDFGDGSTSAADITTYVSPLGREYAIVTLKNSMAFVEVTDPANSVIIDVVAGFDEGSGSATRDIKTYDQYAYAVNEAGGGVQVFDLTQIDSGIVTVVDTGGQVGPNESHNATVNPDSGFLYLTGSSSDNGGLIALDLNNPASPQLVGSWSTRYLHDALAVSYTSGPYAGREIVYGFGEESGVYVIDVSDKANMFTVATVVYPDVSYSHFGALSSDRRYLFVNDELDEKNDPHVSTTTTYVIDVQDPGNPAFLTSFSNGRPAIDHNLMTRGDFLFEANYASGLRIYDVSDVLNAYEVGYYDTFPADDQLGFKGAWGVDTNLPSGVVVVSDIQGGLFVLDAGPTTGPLGTWRVELGQDEFISNLDFGNRLVALDTTPPTADLSVPTSGGTINMNALNLRGYIDVIFNDTGGSGLDTATIDGDEIALSGSGAATAVLSGTATRIGAATYRYRFTGDFVAGPVDVNFVAGTWQDVAGNPNMAETESVAVVDSAGLPAGFWMNHSGLEPEAPQSAWAGFVPSQLVQDTFDTSGSVGTDLDGNAVADTLLDALNFIDGNGVDGASRELLRTGVAALLNAAHPEVRYPLVVSQIVDSVNSALNTGDATTMQGLAQELSALNLLGGNFLAPGDTTMDGEVNSSDLFDLLGAATFNMPENWPATWVTGDFNGDRQFDSTDLFLILAAAVYNNGLYPLPPSAYVSSSEAVVDTAVEELTEKQSMMLFLALALEDDD